MNRIYRKIWSKERRLWVVTSELATSGGALVVGEARKMPCVRMCGLAAAVGMAFTALVAPAAMGHSFEFVIPCAQLSADIAVCDTDSVGHATTATAIGHAAIAAGGEESLLDPALLASHEIVISRGARTQVAMLADSVTKAIDASNKSSALDKASAQLEDSDRISINGSNESAAGAYAEGYGASAIGEAATAIGEGATALGEGATALDRGALALGRSALAEGEDSIALSNGAWAQGAASIAAGRGSWTGGDLAIALGDSAQAIDLGAVAAGAHATADFEAVSIGHAAIAADTSVAVGGLYMADEQFFLTEAAGYASVAVGAGAYAAEYGGISLGIMSEATEQKSIALGLGARAWAHDSIALGAGSLATRAFTVSVGDVGFERQIVNVAPGTESTDAVNKQQLDAVSEVATVTSRYFKAAASVDGDAGVAIDGDGAVAAGESASAFGDAAIAIGKRANALENGAVALGGDALVLAADSVALGSGSRAIESGVISVGSGDGINGPATRRIVNVGEGRITAGSGDAVTGGQLYTTNQRLGVVESRVDGLDGRIDDVEGVAANALRYDDDQRGTATLAGASGTVIDNLAAGSVSAGSMQGINGGQLYDALSSMATLLGGGAALGLQGSFVAPTYVVQGGTYNNVGAALAALDGHLTVLGNRVLEGNDDKGVAVGDGASADQVSGTGVGHGAKADSADGTALGSNAQVLAAGGTALGAGATVAAAATNGVAVGAGAAATAANSTALGQGAEASGLNSSAVGQGASATAANAVALGQGSIADRDATVSVGSKGHERQITNVAAGTTDTDAVNKRQLDQGVASANNYTDGKFAALNDSFDLLRSDIGKQLRHMDRRIDRQGAMGAAMLNMAVSAAGVRTANRMGVGIGFQGGESALSLGYQRALSERATLTVGGAFSSDDSSVGIGAGFGW